MLKKFISKCLIGIFALCLCVQTATVFAERNEDAHQYNFVYSEYGIAKNAYSEWGHKRSNEAVPVTCTSATAGFSVTLVAKESFSSSVSSAVNVANNTYYYMGNGTSCNISNNAISQGRACVAVYGLYQADNAFSATGYYLPY